MTRYLPFLDWLVHYQRENFPSDLVAGVTVALILVPQSMAYAQIGGLPPQIGLYASVLPLLIYGLLGTSRSLGLGPTAITGLVSFAGAAPLAPVGSVEFIEIAVLLAMMSGIIQLVLGLLRAGFLANFLSRPVLVGFLNGAAILVAMSQVGNLLGLQIPRTNYILEPLVYALTHISDINLVTVGITLLSLAILYGFKTYLPPQLNKTNLPKIAKSILPNLSPLVAVIIGSLLIWLLNLKEVAGVSTVNIIATGLPAISLPSLDMTLWSTLLPGAFALAIVGYVEGISVGKSLASRDNDRVIPNQELIAIGAANIGASLTGGMGVSGSFSRSVVNYSAGVKTPLSVIITACIMALILIFLMPLFVFIPLSALGAIILMAVIGMFDWRIFSQMYRQNRLDWLTLMVTFLSVLIFGIERGVFIGIGFALLTYLWRTLQPDIQTHIDTNKLTVNTSSSVYYANAPIIQEKILNTLENNTQITQVNLSLSNQQEIDTTTILMLESLAQELKGRDIRFQLLDCSEAHQLSLEQSKILREVISEAV